MSGEFRPRGGGGSVLARGARGDRKRLESEADPTINQIWQIMFMFIHQWRD